MIHFQNLSPAIFLKLMPCRYGIVTGFISLPAFSPNMKERQPVRMVQLAN